MKLTPRSVGWTVFAAIVTVPVVNMFLSLGSDARALVVGLGIGIFVYSVPISIFAILAFRRRMNEGDSEEEGVVVRQLSADRNAIVISK